MKEEGQEEQKEQEYKKQDKEEEKQYDEEEKEQGKEEAPVDSCQWCWRHQCWPGECLLNFRISQ